jgi:hypothetical protein
MNRKILTEIEIQKKVREIIHNIEEVADDGASIGVPLPQRHEVDRNGCNWDMGIFRNASGYEDSIRAEVEKARQSFNLPD